MAKRGAVPTVWLPCLFLLVPGLWALEPIEELKKRGLDAHASQVGELRDSLNSLRVSGADLPRGQEPPEKVEDGEVEADYAVKVPVHQWIVDQAKFIWSDPEIESYLPAEWSDSLEDLNESPILYGALMEDKDQDFSQFKLCGGRPFCTHFWDPDKGDDGGLFFLRQWDSAYVRAQELWDSKVLPLYREGKIEESYYWLGRITHLLADMSVPSHTHLDIHPVHDSYEKYMTELDHDLPGEHNFKQWTGSGEPVQAASLRELFLSLAETADEFDSNDADGEDPDRPEGHSGRWEVQNGIFRWYDVSYAECRVQGEALMPEAMRHIAGLFKLFKEATRPTLLSAAK